MTLGEIEIHIFYQCYFQMTKSFSCAIPLAFELQNKQGLLGSRIIYLYFEQFFIAEL